MAEQRDPYVIKGNVFPRWTEGRRLTDEELHLIEVHVYADFADWYNKTHDEQGRYIGPLLKERRKERASA